jgi:glutamine synthetase
MSTHEGRQSIIQNIATRQWKLDNIDFHQTHIKELFGSDVFSESVQRERLSKPIFKALHRTIKKGETLNPEIADAVA